MRQNPNAGFYVSIPSMPKPDALNSQGLPFKLTPDTLPSTSDTSESWLSWGYTFAEVRTSSELPEHDGALGIITSPEGTFWGLWSMPKTFWDTPRSEAELLQVLRECFPSIPDICAEAFAKARLTQK